MPKTSRENFHYFLSTIRATSGIFPVKRACNFKQHLTAPGVSFLTRVQLRRLAELGHSQRPVLSGKVLIYPPPSALRIT